MGFKMEKNNSLFGNIVKGSVIAIISTFIMLVIFSTLLTYTNISEQVINPVLIVIISISILIGSSIGNKKIKKNSTVYGALVGIIYILVMFIISNILNNSFSITLANIVFLGIGMVLGILGAIIGVNK